MLPLLATAVLAFAPSVRRAPSAPQSHHVRSTSPSSNSPAFWVHAFEDPLPLLLGTEDVESVVAAQNIAEDMGGLVGGSYLIGGALAVASVSAAFIALSSRAASIEPMDALSTSSPVPAPWKINAHGPVPRGRTWFFGDFSWKTGPLPSLDDLEHSCYMIGEGATRCLYLCLSQVGDDCVADASYSEYYGRRVFLCAA